MNQLVSYDIVLHAALPSYDLPTVSQALSHIIDGVMPISIPKRSEAIPAKPFLRWAGGKHKLLPLFSPLLPKDFGTFFEPFLGSGSVFFSLQPESAHLGDINPHLVEAYIAVRDNVEGLIRLLQTWKFSKKRYYEIRDEYRPRSQTARAARFIFLNRTCWNGLYRENLDGEFNVPVGSKFGVDIVAAEDLRRVSATLAAVRLKSGDFEDIIASAKKNDFVYFDPPYVTNHNNNGFIEYNAKLFTWADQARLAERARDLVHLGVKVAISNAAHEELRKLYKGFTITRISRRGTIAADIEARKRFDEFFITGGY